MPWRPEDWSEWPVERWVATYRDAAHVHAVRDILLRLPDRARGRVVELTRGPSFWHPFLKANFACVVPHELCADAADPKLPQSDLVLAVDTIETSRLRELLPVIHASLVEGGVLVATLTAQPADGKPCEMIGPPSADGVHEVELQYRLRRAGFQGLRLRRFRGDQPTVLCMAVRRALN